MRQIVVDCSVTMSWFLKDEYNEYSQSVREAINGGLEMLVPSLWHIEVANVFLISERRGRVSKEEIRKGLDAIRGLPVKTDFSGVTELVEVVELARLHGLTSYDALYLELARREGVPLATLDEKLQNVAGDAGVSVFS